MVIRYVRTFKLADGSKKHARKGYFFNTKGHEVHETRGTTDEEDAAAYVVRQGIMEEKQRALDFFHKRHAMTDMERRFVVFVGGSVNEPCVAESVHNLRGLSHYLDALRITEAQFLDAIHCWKSEWLVVREVDVGAQNAIVDVVQSRGVLALARVKQDLELAIIAVERVLEIAADTTWQCPTQHFLAILEANTSARSVARAAEKHMVGDRDHYPSGMFLGLILNEYVRPLVAESSETDLQISVSQALKSSTTVSSTSSSIDAELKQLFQARPARILFDSYDPPQTYIDNLRIKIDRDDAREGKHEFVKAMFVSALTAAAVKERPDFIY